jgi:c(7)-type cytochrome triheme protein
MSRSRTLLVAAVATLVIVALGAWVISPSHSLAADGDKHGGDIIFFVKKNKQNRLHVLFSHEAHLDAGHKCNDCHNDKVFKAKRELGLNAFTMSDINKGKACGSCHNGTTVVGGEKVFGPKGNCDDCHDVKLRTKGKAK